MCLLYEFLTLIIKKFFSLNNICRMLMGQTMNMALKYIDSIDDDNFLTTVLLEKDYSGRDCLRIATEMELLDLIQTPKVEAVIKRLYNSDFDQPGSLFQMSTTYQLCFANKDKNEDPESEFRFYKKRYIEKVPQNQWLFEIFKESMNSRIQALGYMGALFLAGSLIYFQIVIDLSRKTRPGLI